MKLTYKNRYFNSYLVAIVLLLIVEAFDFATLRSLQTLAKDQTYTDLLVNIKNIIEIRSIFSMVSVLLSSTIFTVGFFALGHENSRRKQAYDNTIEGWSRALDLRDKETEGHSQRVTEMTLRLARIAGINDKELVQVRHGALLHDIGKMGIPDSILLKPDKLTDEERGIMQKHSEYGYMLLLPIEYLHPALDIPYCHHEKWDGTGYPRGLKGEQIPIAARLFAVVDVWDALTNDRSYRKRWSETKVREHIKSLAGTHFDPKAVEYFFVANKP